LPPVIGLINRRPDCVAVRKLAPTPTMTVNGQPLSHGVLTDGDTIQIGTVELFMRISLPPEDASPRCVDDRHAVDVNERQAQLDQLQRQLDVRAREIDQQSEQLQRDIHELTEKARLLNQLRLQVEHDLQEIARQQSEAPANHAALAEQTTVNETRKAMQEWYRHRLRGMTERKGDAATSTNGSPPEMTSATPEASDRHLGELLRTHGLVDADTLTALFSMANKQRCSLRQLLLSSGVMTLYQLALVEVGNLDGLMLGPVWVMNRTRLNAHEAVYRVYDPRRAAGKTQG
jgi:TolA-binding protein